ncbi:WD40 repeat-like protein [Meredithblackwellia eburnea MCA 4105]
MTTPSSTQFLPRITVQETLPLVIQEINDGTHSAEDVWVSVYKEGMNSVHGRVRITANEEGEGVGFDPRDGVSFQPSDSSSTFLISSPSMSVPPTPVHFPLSTPFKLQKGKGGIDCLALSLKGNRWAAGGRDGMVRVGQRSGGRALECRGHVGDVRGIEFFPSGEVILTCSSDLSLKVFSALDGSSPRTLTGHTRSITSISILPPLGRQVLSVSLDGTLRVWDVGSGNCVTLERFDKPINAVTSWSKEEGREVEAVAGLDNGTAVWLTLPTFSSAPTPSTTSTPRKRIVLNTQSTSPILVISHHVLTSGSESGTLTATGSRDGVVSLFHLPENSLSIKEGDELIPYLKLQRSTDSLTSLSFSGSSSNPSILLSTSSGLPCRLSVPLPNSTEPETKVRLVEEFAGGDCESVVIVGDGEEIWTGDGEGRVWRYKSVEGK